jgi:hypothetical protein
VQTPVQTSTLETARFAGVFESRMRLYAVRLKPGAVPGEVSNRFRP